MISFSSALVGIRTSVECPSEPGRAPTLMHTHACTRIPSTLNKKSVQQSFSGDYSCSVAVHW